MTGLPPPPDHTSKVIGACVGGGLVGIGIGLFAYFFCIRSRPRKAQHVAQSVDEGREKTPSPPPSYTEYQSHAPEMDGSQTLRAEVPGSTVYVHELGSLNEQELPSEGTRHELP